MRLLKPVDYKLKLHLIINTSSMLEFQLRKHNKSCIGITWRDLIMEAEVFDRSAELSMVTGSNLDPKKYCYMLKKNLTLNQAECSRKERIVSSIP